MAARLGIIQPKTHWHFPEQQHWPQNWQSNASFNQTFINNERLPLWKSAFPYILISLLLIITRLPVLPFKSFLAGFEITTAPLLGTEIQASINLLYLPGAVFYSRCADLPAVIQDK